MFIPASNLAPGEVANGNLIFSRPTGSTYTWPQALTYCNNLGNGYRMASKLEFEELYSAKGNMNIAAGWPLPASTGFWSASYLGWVNNRWVAELINGGGSNRLESVPSYVSCVRSGS
ncbi:hypothetical protein D3C78_1711120 [compost metagenome]